jgi:PIN domain nuclease of toxin-antitoxin system
MAIRVIEEPGNVILVSSATVWEFAIKAATGKLRLPAGAVERIADEMSASGFVELPVTWEHAFAVRNLQGPHLDPFDRLLIAQCRIESLTMVTNDKLMRRYEVDWLW